jgi:hypothetical protein
MECNILAAAGRQFHHSPPASRLLPLAAKTDLIYNDGTTIDPAQQSPEEIQWLPSTIARSTSTA